MILQYSDNNQSGCYLFSLLAMIFNYMHGQLNILDNYKMNILTPRRVKGECQHVSAGNDAIVALMKMKKIHRPQAASTPDDN